MQIDRRAGTSVYQIIMERHLEGRERARVFISGRVALRDLVSTLNKKHKVPRPYSGAEDGAPSLTGARDDGLFTRIEH
jgi:hypothetical protein